MDDDTPESLHARIKIVEQRIYPEAIGAIASGEVSMKGRRTVRTVPWSMQKIGKKVRF